jgi:gamma-glutamylcyclotransferase (GGCT)/AIG2-like uncharacterized protein YtfP
MESLFVYGTLMCQEIFEKVAGIVPNARKATLKGFRRFSVKNEYYPGVVGQQGFQVEGLLYDNLSEESWVLLDNFEGDMYRRQGVEIQLEDGRMIDAFVYVVKQEYTYMIGVDDWSFERFVALGKDQFIRDCAGPYGNTGRKPERLK